MGHNIHFICVESDSGMRAVHLAEAYVQDWGNDSNWRSFLRAVSEDGEVVNNDTVGNRYGPMTLEEINACMQAEVGQDASRGNMDVVQRLADRLRRKGRLPPVKWWELRQAAEDLYYGTGAGRGKFDVFRQQYRYGIYDQAGVTHFYSGDGRCRKNRLRRWCVVMDMHS